LKEIRFWGLGLEVLMMRLVVVGHDLVDLVKI
jgi:hypothetical protein